MAGNVAKILLLLMLLLQRLSHDCVYQVSHRLKRSKTQCLLFHFLWRIQWPILIRGKTCSHRDREGQSKVPVAAANISRRCFRGGAAAAGVAPSLTWCSESPSPYCSCWTDRAHCVRPRRGRRRRRETRRSPPAEGSRSDGGKNKNMEK